MIVQQAYRYELDPAAAQREMLAKHAGAARFAYNWGLDLSRARLQAELAVPSGMELHRLWNAWKRENAPWWVEVSKCAPQEALRDLNRAFRNFWRGRKEKRRVGFPKFRKKGQSVTMTREAERWHVSLTVARERPDPQPVQGPGVGIDLGLDCFAMLSEGTWIEAPNPLARAVRRLRRRSRAHSRKQRGSANRRKSALALARLHRCIRNRREDFLHKWTTTLAETKSAIVVEDLSVRNMVWWRHRSTGHRRPARGAGPSRTIWRRSSPGVPRRR